MEKNVGFADTLIRNLLGVLLIVMVIDGTFTGMGATIAVLLAVIFIVTAFIRWCPIWRTLGIRTTKRSE